MSKYKARVILREKIINYPDLVHDDMGLKALDGYFESPVEEIDASNRCDAANSLIEKYKDKLPRYDSADVLFADDSPAD